MTPAMTPATLFKMDQTSLAKKQNMQPSLKLPGHKQRTDFFNSGFMLKNYLNCCVNFMNLITFLRKNLSVIVKEQELP